MLLRVPDSQHLVGAVHAWVHSHGLAEVVDLLLGNGLCVQSFEAGEVDDVLRVVVTVDFLEDHPGDVVADLGEGDLEVKIVLRFVAHVRVGECTVTVAICGL